MSAFALVGSGIAWGRPRTYPPHPHSPAATVTGTAWDAGGDADLPTVTLSSGGGTPVEQATTESAIFWGDKLNGPLQKYLGCTRIALYCVKVNITDSTHRRSRDIEPRTTAHLLQRYLGGSPGVGSLTYLLSRLTPPTPPPYLGCAPVVSYCIEM